MEDDEFTFQTASDPSDVVRVKTFGARHQYKGYFYREDFNNKWTFFLGSEPLVTLCDEQSVRAFIDQVEIAVENYAMKDLRLHLTGCMRCRRTSLGVKNSPCNRGISLFLGTKANVEKVVRALARAVESGR